MATLLEPISFPTDLAAQTTLLDQKKGGIAEPNPLGLLTFRIKRTYPFFPPETAYSTFVRDINDAGIVVGLFDDLVSERGFVTRGFAWNYNYGEFFPIDFDDGSLNGVPAYNGRPVTFTSALGINRTGHIVGRFQTDTDNGGYLRDPAGNYSTQVIPEPPAPFPGVKQVSFNGINDDCLIAGLAIYANGIQNGFLLRPGGNCNDVSTYTRYQFNVDSKVCAPWGISCENVIGSTSSRSHGFLFPLSSIPSDNIVTPTTPGVIELYNDGSGPSQTIPRGIDSFNKLVVGFFTYDTSLTPPQANGAVWRLDPMSDYQWSLPPSTSAVAYSTMLVGTNQWGAIAGQCTDTPGGITYGFVRPGIVPT